MGGRGEDGITRLTGTLNKVCICMHFRTEYDPCSLMKILDNV